MPRTWTCCLFAALLASALPLAADIPFFWLDKPAGRSNPFDPRHPLYAVPTLPTAPFATATPSPDFSTPSATCSWTFSPTATLVPPSPTLTAEATAAGTSTATPSASPAPSLTASPTPAPTGASPSATPSEAPLLSPTATPSPAPSDSPTLSATSTPTRTASPTASASPSRTPPTLSSILYDGDSAGGTLADGTVTSDESATAGTGIMSEAAGGAPGNMMRLTYTDQTGYWQSHNWNKTVDVAIGAHDYLEFDVRQEGATAVSQFKVVLNWPHDVYVEPYLVGGGVITTAWKTVRIPLADLLDVGVTSFDFVAFINNTQATAYTVNIDNLKLLTSVPTPTPTLTQTVNPAWSFTASPTISPTPSGFAHPGAWSSAAELAYVRANIGSQPYAARLANLGNLTRAPGYAGLSVANVINACNGDANIGQTDSQAAYSQALAWAVTGNATYATRAIAILNAWSNLNSIQSSACWVDQKTLDAGWFGANFANAAEIMRTYSGWTAPEIAAFQAMLQRAFVPLLTTASAGNGNVDLTQIDALMSIAVFRDDLAQFNAGIARLALRVPAYIHLSGGAASIPAIAGDGGNPAAFYFNPSSWLAGVQQETCRDNGHHVQFALGSAIHAAEIAWHQGVDVYTTHQDRFVAASELLAKQISSGSMQGACADNVTLSTTGGLADTYNTFEVGYNHYALRKGVAMPETLLLINSRFRPVNPAPAVRWEMLNLMDETLTHAGVN